MSSLTDLISALFGGSRPTPQAAPAPVLQPDPGPKFYQASQPQAYPTHEDAQFARKYDYSYGQPWAPEFNDQIYHLLSGSPNAKTLKIQDLKGEIAKNKHSNFYNEDIPDYYARAALAAQNSGLAMLGFDPKRAALDPMRDPDKVNILGTYNPNTDQIYSNQQHVSNIVHESIHRGMEKLRGSPFWDKSFDKYPEELVVRALMQQRMGNPEESLLDQFPGSEGLSQVGLAKQMFASDNAKKWLNDLDMAASNYIAAKHPGGPH